MRKSLPVLIAACILFALAQEVPERRIITIDSSGGTQSGNLQYGPIRYQHPEIDGIRATVSTLTIFAQEAELRAPEGVLLSRAQGEREATFLNGVRLERGRLTATGPSLHYSEATGIGLLEGPVEIAIAPRDEGEDPVAIRADTASFDVDSDVSESRGNVELTSGRSRAHAQETIYEEERDLAKLVSAGEQVRIVRVDEGGDELVIVADEVRVLTGEDKLLARGNVTLTSGNTISRGDTVFFDDEASRALILGSPAVAENDADGTRTTGAVLEHRTDIDAVRVYSAPLDFAEADFRLSSEGE
jgi:lipopolysaccharide export system protein LptA